MLADGVVERCNECHGAIWLSAGPSDDPVTIRKAEREGLTLAERAAALADISDIGHREACSRRRKDGC